jgi:alpha-beta hydrolase superfamily lysophospholipase
MRIAAGLALVLFTVLAVRAWDAWRSPALSLWHTEAPDELDASAIDAADWAAWLAAEDRAFDQVRTRVTDKLPAADRIPSNRFFVGSPLNMAKAARDWNRSFVLMPDGTPRGVVVLIHGLTDSPYSLRHIGKHYRERGFAVVAMRMPGHGTVPAGLARVRWQDWLAATRLAVRHARTLVAQDAPLHLVGYSNGAALVLKYSLDALELPALAAPDQLVLVSPMIGITRMARFAGVLGWPAVLPPFAKAAWLDIVPEYNPFKYNSFPVNGARQSSQLIGALASQLARMFDHGKLARLPPTLTFQSAVDTTVSVGAIFTTLYDRLPSHGHEIVLFDRNWNADVGAMILPELQNPLAGIVPPQPLRFSVTSVTNMPGSSPQAIEQRVAAESTQVRGTPLNVDYPNELYSLSHVALPFPPDDALYGYLPSSEDFGVRLGTAAVRGERGMLIVSMDNLMRATCNPFFDYVLARIDATLPTQQPGSLTGQ